MKVDVLQSDQYTYNVSNFGVHDSRRSTAGDNVGCSGTVHSRDFGADLEVVLAPEGNSDKTFVRIRLQSKQQCCTYRANTKRLGAQNATSAIGEGSVRLSASTVCSATTQAGLSKDDRAGLNWTLSKTLLSVRDVSGVPKVC